MTIKKRVNAQLCLQFLVLLAVWGLASTALAGGVGGGGGFTAGLGGLGVGGRGSMPWDQGVGTFRASIKNVVCPAMIFAGICIAAWEMFQEGEMKGWGKRGMISVLAGCMGLGADALLETLSSGGLVR